MSKGTNRITIRVPDDLREDIASAVERRNNTSNQTKHWTMTEYIIQAVVDKINHDSRSRGCDERKRQEQPAENFPREYWGE